MSVWSGLGMNIPHITDIAVAEQYLDELKARGILDVRISLRDYTTTAEVTQSKAIVIAAIARGMRPVWGVTSNPTVLTTTTWPDFEAAVLDAAAWAQANGVYEFQVGNEEEFHIDNVTIDAAALVTNIKALGTSVQAVFTNGNVSYAAAVALVDGFWKWDKGGLDIMAMNAYLGNPTSFSAAWETAIGLLISAFGVDHTYLSEFNLSSGSLATYNADESIQAAALGNMLERIKELGLTKAFYFSYVDANLGCKPTQNGDYRLLWNNLTTNNGRRWFI